MRFNLAVAGMFLTVTAQAATVQESFDSNRESILSQATTIVGEHVFSVGRAKSSPKAGDEIGYSKAATLAYGNLDLINYNQAKWPEESTSEERSAAWALYRVSHPFKLTIEGGQRVFWEKDGADKFLMVMSFPKEKVLVSVPRESELSEALFTYRQELKKAQEEAARHAAENSATNVSPLKTVSPINGAVITPCAESATDKENDSTIKKNENFDADLMI